MFKKTVANLVKLVPQVFKHPLTTHNHIGSYHTNFKDLHYFSQSKLNNGFNTQIKKYFSIETFVKWQCHKIIDNFFLSHFKLTFSWSFLEF